MTDSTNTKGQAYSLLGPDMLRASWAWYLALGLTMVVVGALAVALPGVTGLGVTLLLGWLMIIGGVVQALHAFSAPRWVGFFVQAMAAVLYLLVGYLVLANPLASMLTLTILLTAFLLAEGFFRIVLAFQLRPATHWGWIALSGGVAVLLGMMIWTGLPGDSLWVIGTLVGVNIIVNGASTIMLAWAAREAAEGASLDNQNQTFTRA